MKKVQSQFLSLNLWDYAKAVLMVFIAAFVTALYGVINTGSFPSKWEDWRTILLTSAAAAIAYLLKNFFSTPPK
jgi:hypothetical protein